MNKAMYRFVILSLSLFLGRALAQEQPVKTLQREGVNAQERQTRKAQTPVQIGQILLLSGQSEMQYAPGRSGPIWNLSFYMSNKQTNAIVQCEDIDGLCVVEGDMVLGKTSDLQRPKSRPSAPHCTGDVCSSQAPLSAIFGEQYLWPGGVIPYEIDPAYGATTITEIRAGVAMTNALTNLLLVPRTSERDYVFFKRIADGCSSWVGRQTNRQDINIMENTGVRGCQPSGVAHEILHSAGMWHEQSRADRDSYVEILWQNIIPGEEHNFAKHEADGINLGPYDLRSVMHYTSTAFGKRDPTTLAILPTIRTVPPGLALGNTTLSARDISGVNALYPVTSSQRYIAIPNLVFGLRHSMNQTNDVIHPLVDFSGVIAQRIHGGDLGAPSGQGYYWWMIPTNTPLSTVRLEELPPGVVLGLWHSDNMNAIPADPSLTVVRGGDLGAPSGHGFVWYETQLSAATNWDLVDKLPPYTVIGLKHSVNQADKRFVWKDGIEYDSLMFCPDGFDRKQGGDRGASSGQGFCWCEKRGF